MRIPRKLNASFRRGRLVAALVAVGTAVLGVLGIDLYDSFIASIEKARLQAANLSLLLAERITGTLNEADYVLRDVAGHLPPYLASPSPASGGPELRDLIRQKASTLSQVSSIVVYDASGRSLASSDGRTDIDAIDSPFFVALAASPQMNAYTSNLSRSPSGRFAVMRARAVRDSRSRLLAVAAAELDTTYFQNEVAKLDIGEGGFVIIADADFRLVARQPQLAGAIGAESVDATLRSLLRGLAERNDPSLVAYSKGKSRFYSARVSQDFPFFVIVGSARSEVLEEWTVRLATYGATIALICFLLGVLARLLIVNFKRGEELAARMVALESSSDMIVIADLDGRAEYVNPAFTAATGLDQKGAAASPAAIFGPAQTAAALDAVARGLDWRGEVVSIHPSGGELAEEITASPVRGEDGRPTRMVAIKRDVTERRRLQQRLEQLAHYDLLTGLPNRALFFDRLAGAAARARREGKRFALLYIDLDGFKPINDRFGHTVGDLVLREIAGRLRATIRDSDTAGRMGGDEFTVLLDTIARVEDASSVAEKIRLAIAEPVELPDGERCAVRASVGFAIFPDETEDIEALLRRADSSMYAQKPHGMTGPSR